MFDEGVIGHVIEEVIGECPACSKMISMERIVSYGRDFEMWLSFEPHRAPCNLPCSVGRPKGIGGKFHYGPLCCGAGTEEIEKPVSMLRNPNDTIDGEEEDDEHDGRDHGCSQWEATTVVERPTKDQPEEHEEEWDEYDGDESSDVGSGP